MAKKQLRKSVTSQPLPENVTPDEVDEEELDSAEEPETDDVPEEPADSESETEPEESDDVTEEESPQLERLLGAPKDGRTFQPGEKVIVKGIEKGGFIVVQEAVYRAARTPQSSRWRYHLLYSKGAQIPKGKTKIVDKPNGKDDVGTFESTAITL